MTHYSAGDTIPVNCAMFLLCGNEAEGVSLVTVVGATPSCERCASKLGYTLQRGTFTLDEDMAHATFHPLT